VLPRNPVGFEEVKRRRREVDVDVRCAVSLSPSSFHHPKPTVILGGVRRSGEVGEKWPVSTHIFLKE
jgi:hypothetical protein